MPTTRVANYEAMFLISQSQPFGEAINGIRHILERYGATILAMRKWDERRLAYEIKKQKRGIYILAYFSCDTKHLGEIERGFNLSEQVMRFLITRADHMTVDEMKAADAHKELEAEAKLRATQPAAAFAAAVTEPPVVPVDDDEDL
jgi:small subunit ribosomal protein S6